VGRVLLGGLVAGVILNIGEYLLNGVLLDKAMNENFQRLHLSPPGTAFIVKAVVITFLLGIPLIYLYPVIISRLGGGVKAAICAGLIAWFFVYLYAGYIYEALGMVSAGVYLVGLVWGLAEYALSAIAGAWLYKEA